MYKTVFKFYIILKLCFFGVGAHWPPHLAVKLSPSSLWVGRVLIFKRFFPYPVPPFGEVSVRSVRCASCSLLAYNVLSFGVVSWEASREKGTNSATVLILKIDKCLFKIKTLQTNKKRVVHQTLFKSSELKAKEWKPENVLHALCYKIIIAAENIFTNTQGATRKKPQKPTTSLTKREPQIMG